MVRFQCIHCGARIIIHKRFLNRLAVCPECGGVTHPMASHLASSAPAKPAPDIAPAVVAPPAPAENVTRCDNCGQPIGKLLKPKLWDNHRVCDACYEILRSRDEPALAKANPPTSAIVVQPSTPAPNAEGRRAPDFVFALRGVAIGLAATVVAIYLIVMLLQSLGWLFMLGGVIVAALAAVYWVRKGLFVLRNGRATRPARTVDAVVRDA